MSSIAQAAPSVRQPVLAAIANVISALDTAIAQNNLAPWPPPVNGVQKPGTTSAGPLFTQMNQMRALLNLLRANIAGTQNQKKVAVVGGTIYDLAAQYYEDVLQAFAIMEFDGFITPQFPNNVTETVVLPPTINIAPAYGFSSAQVTP